MSRVENYLGEILDESLAAEDANPEVYTPSELELVCAKIAYVAQGGDEEDLNKFEDFESFGIDPLTIIAILNIILRLYECMKERRERREARRERRRGWFRLQEYANEIKPLRRVKIDARIERVIRQHIDGTPEEITRLRETITTMGTSLTEEQFEDLAHELALENV